MYDDSLDLPRDDSGRIVGYGVGREAAMRDWQMRREEREADARVKAALRAAGVRTRKPRTTIDWSAQPLGVDSDASIARALGVAPAVVCNARKRLGIASPTTKRVWTRREDAALRAHFAEHGFGALDSIAAKLGRTRAAVHQRMAVTLRLASTRVQRRWPATLRNLERAWGYDRRRILVAGQRLGLAIPKEEAGRGAFRVTREQADALLAELKRHPDGARLHARRAGEWGPGERCADCGRSSVPRMARERCARCWRALRESERAA